jgi:hypothetical protein
MKTPELPLIREPLALKKIGPCAVGPGIHFWLEPADGNGHFWQDEERRYFTVSGICAPADARMLERSPQMVALLERIEEHLLRGNLMPEYWRCAREARALLGYIHNGYGPANAAVEPAPEKPAPLAAVEQEELDYLAHIGDVTEGV